MPEKQNSIFMSKIGNCQKFVYNDKNMTIDVDKLRSEISKVGKINPDKRQTQSPIQYHFVRR
jgi:hypothetical protein